MLIYFVDSMYCIIHQLYLVADWHYWLILSNPLVHFACETSWIQMECLAI